MEKEPVSSRQRSKTRFLVPLAIGTLLNLLVFCIMHFANDRTNMVRMRSFVASPPSSQMPKLHEWLHAGALESRAGRNPLATSSSFSPFFLLYYYYYYFNFYFMMMMCCFVCCVFLLSFLRICGIGGRAA